MAIGNPTAPRPMPRRLYRFTTERRTSVNRYLLTLDFPWPPPRTPAASPFSSSRPLAAAIPTAALLSPFRRASFSRILLRGSASSAFPLPTFRPASATIANLLRAVGRRGARAAGRPAGGGRQIAGRRSAAVVMKTYEIYSIWADAITPSADRGGGQPPVNPRGYTGRCVCARAYVCTCVRMCVRGVARRRPEDCALALSTDAAAEGVIKMAERPGGGDECVARTRRAASLEFSPRTLVVGGTVNSANY